MIATVEINLGNIKKNWLYLNSLSSNKTETGAVLKANAYGLGVSKIAPALWEAGAKRFFVATMEEAIELTQYLPKGVRIYTLNGYHKKYKLAVDKFSIIPVLNSPAQIISFLDLHPRNKACLQIDIGMRRLGFQGNEFNQCKHLINSLNLDLVMGHLSCADNKIDISNQIALQYFKEKTKNLPNVDKSLSASHGILLGKLYNFNVTRPGIGLYGGIREKGLLQALTVQLPILQTHYMNPGDKVGYGLTYTAKTKKRVATLSGGYADGIMRRLDQNFSLYHNTDPCPILGRISMDLITVDISHLEQVPENLTLLGGPQTINDWADKAGTISHEILVNLSSRYKKTYVS